jgi:hypothetical protein
MRGRLGLDALDDGTDLRRVEADGPEREAQRQVQLRLVRRPEVVARHLAEENALGLVRRREAPPPGKDPVRLRPVEVAEEPLAETHPLVRVVAARGRIVAQPGIPDQPVAHVEPEAGDSRIEPVAADRLELASHRRVAPVEVRLLDGNECRYHWPVRSSSVHAGPPKRERQLFGAPPGAPAAHV